MIHRSKAVKQFLSEGAAARIHLERFPGYAPELDPEEGIWRHLKRVELRNLCCSDLHETRRQFRAACQRLRQKHAHHSELPPAQRARLDVHAPISITVGR